MHCDNSLGEFQTRSRPTPAERQAAVRTVVGTLRECWERGEATDDDEVLAAHVDLLPELAQELQNARMVRSALTTGRRLGPAAEESPFTVLSQAELEAPLEARDVALDDGALYSESGGESEATPKVPGCSLAEQIGTGGQ